MKRVAPILLTVFYLQFILGIAVNPYCCHSKQQMGPCHASLYCNSANQAKNCCKNARPDLKVKNLYLYTRTFSLDSRQFTEFQVPELVVQADKYVGACRLFDHCIDAPPQRSGISLYVFNCNYRI